ncbi:MAG: NAD(P)H-dependent oxidoreductase [Candidatus Omnitrophica bacterium]|nr:NAD(P)H-dependent oxidoreductase [Candidatus Omnitrophota bacterium]
MKSAIIYYSYTGNTHRIAELISGILKEKGEEVTLIRVRPVKEKTNFLVQCREAFLKKKPDISETVLDLGDFEKIIVGSPVWAFKPAPAVNTYLEKCSSVEGKKAICFVTYGSGTGRESALRAMGQALNEKGARVIASASFQQSEGAGSCRGKLKKILEL